MGLLLDRHRELVQALGFETTLVEDSRKLAGETALMSIASEECDGFAIFASTAYRDDVSTRQSMPTDRRTCSSDAVNVIFDCKREGIIDHSLNVRDIKSTSGDIGCDQQTYPTCFEVLKCFYPSTLRHVAVQTTDAEASTSQHALNPVGLPFV